MHRVRCILKKADGTCNNNSNTKIEFEQTARGRRKRIEYNRKIIEIELQKTRFVLRVWNESLTLSIQKCRVQGCDGKNNKEFLSIWSEASVVVGQRYVTGSPREWCGDASSSIGHVVLVVAAIGGVGGGLCRTIQISVPQAFCIHASKRWNRQPTVVDGTIQ